jgi:hypothetical protein
MVRTKREDKGKKYFSNNINKSRVEIKRFCLKNVKYGYLGLKKFG